MNYYEQIQKSIDYIEKHLEDSITAKDCAKAAYMSVAHFYRMFFAITGHQAKEYIRMRRMSLAAEKLKNGTKVIEVAFEYTYDNSDTFSRAFKKETGFLPSVYSTNSECFSFERIDIMSKFSEAEDKVLSDTYPNIKVLKELESFEVASYTAHSKTPENEAFAYLKEWAISNGLLNGNISYRVFGFDVPDSLCTDGTYSYEVWITVPKDFYFMDEKIIRKHFSGGLYAVTSTTVGEIVDSWKRFNEWLNLSKYQIGGHQCLEEHYSDDGFENRNPDNQGDIRVNLYMPIIPKKDMVYTEKTVSPVRVAYCREYGDNSEQIAHKVWSVMLEFAKKNNLGPDKCRIFMYNNGFRKVKQSWHEIMITLDENFSFEDELVKDKIFNGGEYLTTETNLNDLAGSWQTIGKYAHFNHYKAGHHQWIEEWELSDFNFPEKSIRIFYPINVKG